MDLVPYINTAVQCLAGAIGTEGVNPTCAAWGFPTVGFLPQLMNWSPVLAIVGIVFGGPMVVWLAWKLFDTLGIDL